MPDLPAAPEVATRPSRTWPRNILLFGVLPLAITSIALIANRYVPYAQTDYGMRTFEAPEGAKSRWWALGLTQTPKAGATRKPATTSLVVVVVWRLAPDETLPVLTTAGVRQSGGLMSYDIRDPNGLQLCGDNETVSVGDMTVDLRLGRTLLVDSEGRLVAQLDWLPTGTRTADVNAEIDALLAARGLTP